MRTRLPLSQALFLAFLLAALQRIGLAHAAGNGVQPHHPDTRFAKVLPKACIDPHTPTADQPVEAPEAAACAIDAFAPHGDLLDVPAPASKTMPFVPVQAPSALRRTGASTSTSCSSPPARGPPLPV